VERSKIESRLKLGMRIILPALLLILAYWQRKVLGGVLKPVLVGLLLAYIFDPFVTRLERGRFRMPRQCGILLLGLTMLVFIVLVGWLLIPGLVRELADLVARVPDYAQLAGDFLYDRFGKTWEALPETTRDWLRGFFSRDRLLQTWQDRIIPYLEQTGYDENAQAVARGIRDASSAIIGGVVFTLGLLLGGVTGAFNLVFSLVLAVIVSFYLLKDFPNIKQKVVERVAEEHRDHFLSVVNELDTLVSGFFRGQLLVCFCIAVMTGIGMVGLGVNKPLLVAFCAGAFNVVPYLGPVMGAMPAIVLTVAEYYPMGFMTDVMPRVIGIVIWFAFVQTMDGLVISPRIMSRTVRLHPLIILFALLVGGQLFGLVGIMLAVPTVAVIKILCRQVYIILYKRPTGTSPQVPVAADSLSGGADASEAQGNEGQEQTDQ